jgi:hypothetical protein
MGYLMKWCPDEELSWTQQLPMTVAEFKAA